jgi:hypothetical protein
MKEKKVFKFKVGRFELLLESQCLSFLFNLDGREKFYVIRSLVLL